MSNEPKVKPCKLLICTPVYDWMVPIEYVFCYVDTIQMLLHYGVEWSLHTGVRNLISVTRNNCAHLALDGGYDKILFIDSDVSWRGIDIAHLLSSDKDIIGGLYPFKAFPVKLNFIAKKDPELGDTFDINDYIKKHADNNGEVEVDRIPTGFLMINTSVFKKIWPLTKEYMWKDGMSNEPVKERDFFPIGPGKNGHMNTEDWGFCELAEEAGYKFYWQTKVIVDHIGRHRYSATKPLDYRGLK